MAKSQEKSQDEKRQEVRLEFCQEDESLLARVHGTSNSNGIIVTLWP